MTWFVALAEVLRLDNGDLTADVFDDPVAWLSIDDALSRPGLQHRCHPSILAQLVGSDVDRFGPNVRCDLAMRTLELDFVDAVAAVRIGYDVEVARHVLTPERRSERSHGLGVPHSEQYCRLLELLSTPVRLCLRIVEIKWAHRSASFALQSSGPESTSPNALDPRLPTPMGPISRQSAARITTQGAPASCSRSGADTGQPPHDRLPPNDVDREQTERNARGALSNRYELEVLYVRPQEAMDPPTPHN